MSACFWQKSRYAWLVRLLGLRVRLQAHTFSPPRRTVILLPGGAAEVLLATALLSSLGDAYPQAVVDWCVLPDYRPLIASHPRLNRAVVIPEDVTQAQLAELLRQGQYDTCLVPDPSAGLAYVAWRAGIPQRIGPNLAGKGMCHTLPVPASRDQSCASTIPALISVFDGNKGASMTFQPTDEQRAAILYLLATRIEWHGEKPLVLLDPSAGIEGRVWPVETFVRLGSRLSRLYGAEVVVVGSDVETSEQMMGLLPAARLNLTATLSLGEQGALAEVASLFAGNHGTGPLLAIAVDCPTVALVRHAGGHPTWPCAGMARTLLMPVEGAEDAGVMEILSTYEQWQKANDSGAESAQVG